MAAKHNEQLSLKTGIEVKADLLSQRNNIGNISFFFFIWNSTIIF